MLFSNSISSITNNPLISETTPNVGQFGWTQADIGNYNQLLIYVDQCRQYAEFCAEKAEYISYTVSNVVLPALDEMNQIQDQVTGISEDINNIYNSILVINGDITVKYDDFLIKYSDFITKYSDFLPKYDEVLVAHGEVLTYRNEAQAFAESSETSAANSQHYYDLTYSIYLELQDGRVYRGTWNPHTLAYPNPLGTNSLWDVILNEGEATFDFDGKTWKWGEKLLYLTSDGLYQQIQSGSSVYSVNGEIGFVTITLDDLGGFAKTGGTITGKTTFTNSTTGINIEGGTGTSGTSGDLRFNTSLLEFEGYASGEWKPVGGGGSVTWSSVNTNTTAQVGKGYLVNASGLTITLPASPAPGKTVGIGDYNSQNFSVTIARNGKPIMGKLEDLVFNTKNSNVVLAYIDNTVGWILTQGFGESQAPYAVFNKIRKTDVAGQSGFAFASPATNAVDVYYNGRKLDPVTDYVVTTSDVTLTTPVLASDDVIEIYGWNQALILNADGISYDNSSTGLPSSTMQGAIDSIYNSLSEQSGELTPDANWASVPSFSDPLLGVFLNSQAEALSARTEKLKLGMSQSLYSFGATGLGVDDDYAEVQNASSSPRSIECGDGKFKLSQQVVMSVPKKFVGNGSTTKFETTTDFTGSVFRISPNSGSDPKGWTISDFSVTNKGSANNIFLLDISASGKYLSKLDISGVISTDPVSNYFVELLNPTNIDGLFTSKFCDNWSFGGYYLDNIGDSVVLERNTTTGPGVGYYVNQLGTAANITIRDGNCTSASGALNQVKGANLIFEGMQVECPVAFTGVNNAAISISRPSGGSIYNTKLLNNNINTQGNPQRCIYLNNAVQTTIEGNELYCDVSTGSHIYIDIGSRDTVIGNNKYYNHSTGAETDPLIIDNGVGTFGVWKDAVISLSGWTSQGTANEHPLGFYKNRDGEVQLRGRVAGASTTAGVSLFTLPIGFRPKSRGYILSVRGVVGGSPSFVDLHVTPAGSVLILTANATGIYLSGEVFSIK